MADIRTIKITKQMSSAMSEVPEDMPEDMPIKPAAANRRNRRTRRQAGGEPASVGSIGAPIINITKIPDTASAKAIIEQAQAPEQKGGSSIPAVATGGSAAPSNVPPGPQIHVGGTQVVLKRKNRTSKVLLKKKTVGGVQQNINPAKTMTDSGPVTVGGGKKMRKVTIRHVRNKLKRSHKAVKHAKQIPIDKLKKVLIEKKLIKPTSKAPESILRQIYADSIIVGKKTL